VTAYLPTGENWFRWLRTHSFELKIVQVGPYLIAMNDPISTNHDSAFREGCRCPQSDDCQTDKNQRGERNGWRAGACPFDGSDFGFVVIPGVSALPMFNETNVQTKQCSTKQCFHERQGIQGASRPQKLAPDQSTPPKSALTWWKWLSGVKLQADLPLASRWVLVQPTFLRNHAVPESGRLPSG